MGTLRRSPSRQTGVDGRPTASRSVYEQRNTRPDANVDWERVGEFDPEGRFVAEQDWTRRVTGWQPLEEFLGSRT